MPWELIIGGGTVLTLEPGAAAIENGAVAVEGGRIAAVGAAGELREKAPDVRTLDAGGGLILPGFVNTHTHLAMVLLRGFADDLPLKDWLEKRIWPAEKALMDQEAVALGTRLAAAESLLAGVTCVCDMYFHGGRIMKELAEIGLRAVVPESLIDFPTPSCPTPEKAFETQQELLAAYRDHPLITPAVAPHSPYSVCAANLVREAEIAEEHGCPLIIHVAETRWEAEKVFAEKGVSPVAYLADLGILTERTVAAHCVHVSPADIDMLGEFEVGVASNPVSNLKLGSGIAPVPQMLEAGVKVAFGTDGAASNNTLDLLRDAQIAALVYKGVMSDPTVMPARTIVEMLTVGGARVLGLEEQIGTLQPGKRADVICLGVDSAHATPVFDPWAHVAYAARASDVRHVVIEGRVLIEDRQPRTLDVRELKAGVDELSARIRSLA